jgi:aminoglycoside 3-N-acetyltransferase
MMYVGWEDVTYEMDSWPEARATRHRSRRSRKAGWLTADHPLNYGFGRGSPQEKLCEVGGEVLLLGTPLDTVTLLHFAESLADVPDKRTVRYRQPILMDGRKTWVEVEEYDSNLGVMRDYDEGNHFEAIVEAYLAAGHGRTGLVGTARSYLFDARDLTAFGVDWMERTFGVTSEGR